MEQIVERQPAQENGKEVLNCVSFEGEQITLGQVNLVKTGRTFKFNNSPEFLNRQVEMVGDCNIIGVQEDGLEQERIRFILQETVNEHWFLVSQDELNSSFTELK